MEHGLTSLHSPAQRVVAREVALDDRRARVDQVGRLARIPREHDDVVAAAAQLLDDPAPDAVSADLATFAGRPAVVVVVTRAGASTAWAVERSCTTGAPGLLAGATPVP